MGFRFRGPIFPALAFWLAIVVMLSGCSLASQFWQAGPEHQAQKDGWADADTIEVPADSEPDADSTGKAGDAPSALEGPGGEGQDIGITADDLDRALNKLFGGILGALLETDAAKPSPPSPSPDQPGREAGVKARGLFWEAKRGEAQVYLLGSVHVGFPELYPLRPEIEDAFRDAPRLAVEADVTSGTALMTAALRMFGGWYTDGRTYKDELPADVAELIEQKKKENPLLQMTVQDAMKPWMVLYMIIGTNYWDIGFDPEYGIDVYFLKKAKEDGKTILELEGVDAQLSIFERFDRETVALLLREELSKTPQEVEQSLNTIFDYWTDGDARALGAMIDRDNAPPEKKRYVEAMYDQRNRRMAERIDALSKEEKTPLFVIVGAAHLVGQYNVLDALKAKGFTVTQK